MTLCDLECLSLMFLFLRNCSMKRINITGFEPHHAPHKRKPEFSSLCYSLGDKGNVANDQF